MNDPDGFEDLAELETRLRAWRPAAVPPDTLARLVAAGPVSRRRPRTLPRLGKQLLAWGLCCWVYHALRLPDEPRATRPAPPAAPFVGSPWNPGTALTMTLATGTLADNLPAPWQLDGGPATADGLFGVRSADGKLPLKVDCQF